MTEIDCNFYISGQLGKGIELHEFDISHYCVESSERYFAEIVGCIENTVISEDFLKIQSEFLDTYYKEFVEDEENRLEYMEIFQKYLSTVEKYIEEQLVKSVPGFDIRTFQEELQKNPKKLDGEIYDMLSTFWDFTNFKQMFLEFKRMKEGNSVDFSKDILVTKYTFHCEEKPFIQ
ncbi:hypothetical protein ABEB36_002862 [Hypothenemus hampei]|uniref:ADP-ribosylation factor-like protein 2-binding protein n=1 Tax=Hypothenemus hampei TaxID=57062 RepID=A0ABD1F789_HYPHA